MDLLTRLRSKSPLIRAQYALGTAGVVTGIIALVWISALPARFAGIGDLGESATTTTPTLRADPRGQFLEEEPVYQGVTEGLEALGGGEIGGTSTPASTRATTSSTSVPRVIQLATTSQNGN